MSERIHFIGDGPRDEDITPHLVAEILQRAVVKAGFEAWHDIRVHGGAGGPYYHKLRYVLGRERQKKTDGVVAVVDKDEAARRERLNQLREAGRAVAGIRVAIGEAVPHHEAWLIDDPRAVREALSLPGETHVENAVGGCYPKEEVARLLRLSDHFDGEDSAKSLTIAIASKVSISRCNHRDDTGFAEFHKDVTEAFAA